MSVLRFIRNSVFLFKKEAFLTSAVYKRNLSEQDSEFGEIDSKSRTEKISVETSILYLKSEEYSKTYGKLPVWTFYRRNFKGTIAPKTRKSCIRNNEINTASPCPICRDKYLILDYSNVELLKQFFSKHGEYVLDSKITGLCQKQQQNLMVAIAKAKDYGLITFDAPFRYFNYEYYKKI